MKNIAFYLLPILACSLLARADLDKPATKSNAAPKYKSKLREDEPATESFTSKVKIVRDVQDDTEVFFEGDKARGAYLLPATLKDFTVLKGRLQKSQAVGGPDVSVTIDGDKKIQNVEIQESKNPAAAAPTWDKI